MHYVVADPRLTAPGFSLTVERDRVTRILSRALRPFQGDFISVAVWEGKGPQRRVLSGRLVACYSSGFLLQESRYRTWINWLDVWTGHAEVREGPGAAVAEARARLCGGNWEAVTIEYDDGEAAGPVNSGSEWWI